MKIRKQFKFEGAHIVRNCSSERCKYSIHGHSYIVELFLAADGLDNGQMVYDFGLLKNNFAKVIDAFDHTIVIWNKDSSKYVENMKFHSQRYIVLPVSPSAEMFSLLFLKIASRLFSKINYSNGEKNVRPVAVRVHETATGYAEAEESDLFNDAFMEKIDLTSMEISESIKNDDPLFWEWFQLTCLEEDKQ